MQEEEERKAGEEEEEKPIRGCSCHLSPMNFWVASRGSAREWRCASADLCLRGDFGLPALVPPGRYPCTGPDKSPPPPPPPTEMTPKPAIGDGQPPIAPPTDLFL